MNGLILYAQAVNGSSVQAQHGPSTAHVRALRGPVALDGLVWPVVGT